MEILSKIDNSLGSERSVELPFVCMAMEKYCNGKDILDVGGIPTSNENYTPIYHTAKKINCKYSVCDFRGGEFQGDFVTYDFKNKKFDCIIFLSSLEHFPQCTEGDMKYRKGEDIKGFKKALSILKEKGKIILTVPFGKYLWQPHHQNYDLNAINKLTEGSSIITSATYKLNESRNCWELTLPEKMKNILYTSKAHGVGCFVLEKN